MSDADKNRPWSLETDRLDRRYAELLKRVDVLQNREINAWLDVQTEAEKTVEQVRSVQFETDDLLRAMAETFHPRWLVSFSRETPERLKRFDKTAKRFLEILIDISQKALAEIPSRRKKIKSKSLRKNKK